MRKILRWIKRLFIKPVKPVCFESKAKARAEALGRIR